LWSKKFDCDGEVVDVASFRKTDSYLISSLGSSLIGSLGGAFFLLLTTERDPVVMRKSINKRESQRNETMPWTKEFTRIKCTEGVDSLS